jgi:hypothetical protein
MSSLSKRHLLLECKGLDVRVGEQSVHAVLNTNTRLLVSTKGLYEQ